MRNTQSEFDPFQAALDIAAFQTWGTGGDDNGDEKSARTRRLLKNLSFAIDEELTPRQREFVKMRFYEGKRVTDIAKECGVTKGVVSKTINRAMDRLFHTLRWSL